MTSLVSTLLATLLCLVPSPDSAALECVEVPAEVIDEAMTVLTPRLESKSDPNFHPSAHVLENELYRFRNRESGLSEPVLCLLLNFYLGEANDEDVLYETTNCGGPCLGLVKQYLENPPCVPASVEPVMHAEEIRKQLLQMAIEAIQRGETIGDP